MSTDMNTSMRTDMSTTCHPSRSILETLVGGKTARSEVCRVRNEIQVFNISQRGKITIQRNKFSLWVINTRAYYGRSVCCMYLRAHSYLNLNYIFKLNYTQLISCPWSSMLCGQLCGFQDCLSEPLRRVKSLGTVKVQNAVRMSGCSVI